MVVRAFLVVAMLLANTAAFAQEHPFAQEGQARTDFLRQFVLSCTRGMTDEQVEKLGMVCACVGETMAAQVTTQEESAIIAELHGDIDASALKSFYQKRTAALAACRAP